MSTVNDIQDALQDTTEGGAAIESEDEEEMERTKIARQDPRLQVTSANCSGTGGCGKTFPSNEVGSEPRFAMLCASCYSKKTTNDRQPPLQRLLPPPPPHCWHPRHALNPLLSFSAACLTFSSSVVTSQVASPSRPRSSEVAPPPPTLLTSSEVCPFLQFTSHFHLHSALLLSCMTYFLLLCCHLSGCLSIAAAQL